MDLVELDAEVGTSVVAKPLCGVCKTRLSIYTCPRCAIRTCSAVCSKAHKQEPSPSSSGHPCTGERNKAAFVPINQYGWGTMMDDYAFLEDVGRKVGEWGKEISRGGFSMAIGGGRGRGQTRQRGRGVGTSSSRATTRVTKRDILKTELDLRDIDLELLPLGMERRKLNQSNWDHKHKTALLTIEFKFHPPQYSTQANHPAFSLLTHRNSIDKTLISILRSHVDARLASKLKKQPGGITPLGIPPWVTSLIHPDSDDPEAFRIPHCVMRASTDEITNGRGGYYSLDPNDKLSTSLQHSQFVEFPTIEVWEEFQGIIVSEIQQGSSRNFVDLEETRARKRRRLDVKTGKQAMRGIVGGYGSEDDSPKAREERGVLTLLGTYLDEDTTLEKEEEEEEEEENPEDRLTDNEDEDHELVYPADILELIRQARETNHEEDEVDWADTDEEDVVG